MSGLGLWLTRALNFWRKTRDESLDWQLGRHQELAALRQAHALSEQALVAQLKIQAQQLAHELALNQVKNQNKLAMLKTQCQQDLKDYQQYLQALDRLKQSLKVSYAHLPEAVAFTIHHHAKQLLNSMWDARDTQEKLRLEIQLIRFMTAVHEDSQMALQAEKPLALPQKAMAIIDHKN